MQLTVLKELLYDTLHSTLAAPYGACLELVYNVAQLGHHLALYGQGCHSLTAGVCLPQPPQDCTSPVSKGWV